MTPIPQNEAPFTLAEVLSVTGGRCRAQHPAGSVRGVTTDSRLCAGGKLFVALAGERFDAHDFAGQAELSGAAAVLAERDVSVQGVPVIIVPSTLRAIGQLAAFHRRRWAGKLVAIAGSAGKTTTRSTVGQLLEFLAPGRVHATPGNLNNQIGVPMVLLGLKEAHELAVVELGTNQPGEVEWLTSLAQPDYAVLTLIDLEHTEGLTDMAGVEQEETAILRASSCPALGNGDDLRVSAALEQLVSGQGRRALRYGFGAHCDYRVVGFEVGRDGSAALSVQAPSHRVEFTTPYVGRPGALASVAALAIAEQVLDVTVEATALEGALVAGADAMRLTVRRIGHLTVIDDCYNANPASMRAGLETARIVANANGARLVLVLGEMRELGSLSEEEHVKIGDALESLDPSLVLAVGGHAQLYLRAAGVGAVFEPTAAAAIPHVLSHCRAGDVVLVKGSRGVALERVIAALEAHQDSYR